MKVLFLILLVVVIMLIAKGVANQYKDRHNFFISIMNFLNSYELNIGFKKEKIKDLVEKVEAKSYAKMLFEEYKKYLVEQKELTFEDIKIITEDERIFLIDMFHSIGINDYSNEMKQLKFFQNYIQDKINTCEKESSKNYPLIIKLSFLFSIGIALVFV